MNRSLVMALEAHPILTCQQAYEAGATESALRRAVRSGALVRVAPGVYVSSARWSRLSAFGRHDACLRAVLARLPGTAAAADSAAVLWRLPLPGQVPSKPVLLRPRSAHRPEYGECSRWAVVRRAWLDNDEWTELDGHRVTTPERTVVDLARRWTLPWTLAAADAALRARLVTQGQLLHAAARRPSVPGHARALSAARLANPLAESAMESVARGVMAGLGLPEPELQVWLGELSGEYRVDLLVREHRTVIEVDGRCKYIGPAGADQRWRDKRRQDRLLELGYDVHRFVAGDANRPLTWGRALLVTFDRSRRPHGLPAREWPYPWAS